MQNVIATLPERVSPEAMQAGAPEGLRTGHISIAAEIFKTFAEDADDTKIKTIGRWADALTCDQFAAQIKDAQELADKTDAACGFVKPANAKGQEQYGPKRRVLNQRMSEAKRIFGVLKLDPFVVAERGYFNAVNAAREYLDSKGLKWDGTPLPTESQKASKKANREANAALEAAKDANPQQAGESIKDWMERIAPLADEFQQEEKVNRVVETLKKMHSEGHPVLEAIFNFLALQGTEQMHLMAQQLHETAQELDQ